jgi:hypothetical protein
VRWLLAVLRRLWELLEEGDDPDDVDDDHPGCW